jgi:formate/nitrite transporter FocA (FNT family)
VLARALLTLLSSMLAAADSTIARMVAAYMVGFLLAIGPFDHVVVSALHLLFGIWLSNEVGYGDLLEIVTLSTVENLAGGLLLVTLTHTAQVKAR